MARVINITKTQRKGAYADVIDFLNDMGAELGNATNAAAVLLRKTREYKQWRSRQHAGVVQRKAG